MINQYRVLIRGQNLLINVDGQIQKMGFYTSRLAEAENAEQAGSIAVEKVRVDAKLKGIILNRQDDPMMLYVDEIDQVEFLETTDEVEMGFVYYPENSDSNDS